MSRKMINTKNADRRVCAYKNIGELMADLDRIESANHAGTLRCSGNWTAGMNLEHVAKTFEYPLDGFPFKVAPPARWIASLLLKKRLLAGESFPAGISPPPKFLIKGDISAPFPSKNTTFQEGVSRLRTVLERLKNGAQFTIPSPVFGKMTHNETMKIQLSHAALHLGFMNISC